MHRREPLKQILTAPSSASDRQEQAVHSKMRSLDEHLGSSLGRANIVVALMVTLLLVTFTSAFLFITGQSRRAQIFSALRKSAFTEA